MILARPRFLVSYPSASKRGKFLRGSFLISFGGFLSKAIGALSRIPILSALGAEGMGAYQLVFPLYAFLLTFCSSGVATSISKMVADERYLGGKGVLFGAAKLFFALGTLLGAGLFLLSEPIARMLGEEELFSSFRALSFAIPFVALLSVLRGWFQGKNEMLPTALSMVEENSLKVLLGVTLSTFSETLSGKVEFFFWGLAASEALSFATLFLRARRQKFRLPLYGRKVSAEEILKTSFPISLSVSVLPFSSWLDSVLIVKLLKKFTVNALSLYGVYAGGALTFFALPSTLCYGLAASVVPALSAVKEKEESKKLVSFSLFLTAGLSILMAAGLYCLIPLGARTLFSGMSAEEKGLLVSLVRTLFLGCVFAPLNQTLSACLSAKGKAGKSFLSMLLAVGVKTVLLLLFVNEKNGIAGAVWALNGCHFTAFMLNLFWNKEQKQGERYDNHRRARRGQGRLNAKRQAGDFARG